MKGTATDLESSSFEDILHRLETVVETLEKGDLPLERSLEVFEEGVRLSRLGTQRLEAAESRVEQLLERDHVETRQLEDEETQ
jgi:exodeoxyribonuclease VII small subunit